MKNHVRFRITGFDFCALTRAHGFLSREAQVEERSVGGDCPLGRDSIHANHLCSTGSYLVAKIGRPVVSRVCLSMTDNPYAAPESSLDPEEELGAIPGAGTFLLDRCLIDGWNKTIAHIGLVLITGFIAWVLFMVGYISIIGIVLLWPVIAWGGSRFTLNVHDGRPSFIDLFSGIQQYSDVALQALILCILVTLVGAPASVVVLIATTFDSVLLLLVGMLFSAVYSCFVMSRLGFSFFFLVDQRVPAVRALQSSWKLTGPLWGRTILLALISYSIANSGILAFGVGVFFTIPVSYLMWVSAYRQAVGRQAPSPQ